MARIRSDNPEFQAELLRQTSTGILPPSFVEIGLEHMPFWNAITEARAAWTKVDLIHAVNLARTLYQIEEETRDLASEGTVIENARGTMVMNPRHSILETLSRRAAAISSKLQVHAAATIGEPENNRRKNKAKQDAVQVSEMIEDDDEDLLARPAMN